MKSDVGWSKAITLLTSPSSIFTVDLRQFYRPSHGLSWRLIMPKYLVFYCLMMPTSPILLKNMTTALGLEGVESARSSAISSSNWKQKTYNPNFSNLLPTHFWTITQDDKCHLPYAPWIFNAEVPICPRYCHIVIYIHTWSLSYIPLYWYTYNTFWRNFNLLWKQHTKPWLKQPKPKSDQS